MSFLAEYSFLRGSNAIRRMHIGDAEINTQEQT